jgi:hypothetical protein
MAEPIKEKRRSKRYQVRIPATMRGVDAMGRGFFLQAEVISLDAHGARIQWRYLVKLAKNVEVQLTNENVPRLFRVIRGGELGRPEDKQTGLEFVDAKESWNLAELVAKWGLENL